MLLNFCHEDDEFYLLEQRIKVRGGKRGQGN